MAHYYHTIKHLRHEKSLWLIDKTFDRPVCVLSNNMTVGTALLFVTKVSRFMIIKQSTQILFDMSIRLTNSVLSDIVKY